MAKILRIGDNDVSIGKDDGTFVVVNKTEFDFTPVVGETVDLFTSEGKIIVTRAPGNTVIQVVAPPTAKEHSKLSRVVALILWIFFGWIGGHRFYVGKVGTALLFIGLQTLCFIFSILSLGLGFFVFAVPTVWLFVDLYYILAGKFVDSEGLVVSEW